jgi:multidrug efflux pump subunit AcrA (membrane-fusion protein)
MNRLKALPWVLGVCLLAISLVAAKSLVQTDPGKADRPAPPAAHTGTIALGTVDSDPGPVRVGPPGIPGMQIVVSKVFVKDGDEVAEGAPLVQFDDTVFQAKLKQARAELAAATQDKAKAEAAKQIHTVNLNRQDAGIKAAREQMDQAQKAYKIASDQLEALLRIPVDNQPLTDAQKQKRREENLDLIMLQGKVTEFTVRLADEEKKLEALKLNPVDADIARAAAQIEACNGKILEAQAVIDACLVKARGAGVVEQVYAAAGMTFGPSTREPLMRLIPAGKRVVRAEVEAEFAFKVADKIGKKAVIYDANNFALTYEGTLVRVPTAFLPKRTAADVLTVAPSLVLECLIEVADPAPPGKPPLRVGQPVRVTIQ